jgi:hypothetical protein
MSTGTNHWRCGASAAMLAVVMGPWGASPAAAQERRAAAAPLVILAGSEPSPATGPTRAPRRLTDQERAQILRTTFPDGIPGRPSGPQTVDPTGLTKPVVLGPSQLFDAERTAGLMILGGRYWPPDNEGHPGEIEVYEEGVFSVRYRPAAAGAPVMVECEVDGLVPTTITIKAYDQTAPVVPDIYVPEGPETITLFVVPKYVDFTPLAFRITVGAVRLHACAVTPLT